jgi:hypothetical protein
MSWDDDHYRKHEDSPLSNRAFRDLWYRVARLREAKGDTEGARLARQSARIIDPGCRYIVTPRPKRPKELERERIKQQRRAVPEAEHGGTAP